MSKSKSSRRNFLKQNSMMGAGVLLGFKSAESIDGSLLTNNQPSGKKVFVAPSYFKGSEDFPDDMFDDLVMIRKGSANMTIGSGDTSLEPILNVDEWAVKADALKKIYLMLMGNPPAGIDCPLSIRIENEVDHGDIIERRISYLLSPGERVASIMMIPKGTTHSSPAILTIHPTTVGLGKEIVVGRGEKKDGKLTEKAYNRAYALHLTERGYITFSPDILGDGERVLSDSRPFDNQKFIDQYPEWSGTGKDMWDMKRALDVMQTFPEIDSTRIGSIGHSQGAILTYQLAAIDERIKVGVSNCGVWPLNVKRNPFNAARTGWWTGRPALRPFFYAGKPMPVDVHEVLALSAPRPMLVIQALNDWGFQIEDEPLTRKIWDSMTGSIKKIYKLFDAEDKFETVVHLGGHDFPGEMRDKAYTYIDKYL